MKTRSGLERLSSFGRVSSSPDPEGMAGPVQKLGFVHLGIHVSKNVRHYAQGDINFILNMEPGRPGRRVPPRARSVGQRHGVPGHVDASVHSRMALERGAQQ
jgi:4-hydroxyphenylpyruvate dioxygenase